VVTTGRPRKRPTSPAMQPQIAQLAWTRSVRAARRQVAAAIAASRAGTSSHAAGRRRSATGIPPGRCASTRSRRGA